MEQLNSGLPVNQEDNQPTVLDSAENKNPSLLHKVRPNFGIFGGISLLFGASYTFLFYKARLGLNILLFTVIMTVLLVIVIKSLSIKVKRGTAAYYTGVLLLGASCLFTSSWILHFLNIIGILLLLDLSLLHQFYDDQEWDLLKHLTRMLLLPFSCIATIAMPFKDSLLFFQNTEILKNKKVRNILLGVVISLPLLGIMIGLLSSADLLFRSMFKNIYTFIFSSNLFAVIFMIIMGFLACYCIICGSTAKAGIEEVPRPFTKADASIAVTALVLLSLVYAIFCGIQILYLFTGGFSVLPKGFTFSEYARRGFFELLLVTAINILLIIFSTKYFEDSKLIRIILTFMTVCTYIMIGSAAYRMILYIGAYNLTFLRLFVLLFLFIDTFVLAGVIIYVFNRKFPLFHYCVIVTGACYIAFSFSKPDYYIAYYQIQQKEELDIVDINFLTNVLSLDAAPVVLPALEEMEESNNMSVGQINDFLTKEDFILKVEQYHETIRMEKYNRKLRDFNFSYEGAYRALNK
ncbi:MAG: DUF4173 domain-containing protein [Anaerocolumna aminovalerica]|jgi:hypothetical protein|uniref:DUF4153 domain-containing protein n=1 Tax=Anaerocolumna aminovalerica TaxID=1527 RepID=UPI002912F6DF|nr:DUF4173 domain-containing protein [Anaerocolumna aminovalerica]MDU6266752.1 DUF4173 domain-containing protein [Anaerocolumna aminovalerica]